MFRSTVLAALGLLGATAAQAQTAPPPLGAALPDSAVTERPTSVVLATPSPRPPVRRVRVDPWWGYDKAQHFVASGLVTVSAQYLYEVKGGVSRRVDDALRAALPETFRDLRGSES